MHINSIHRCNSLLAKLSITIILGYSFSCFAADGRLVKQPPSAASSQKYFVDINTQDLSAALIELGVRLGISIIIPENAAPEGKARIEGHYSAEEALDHLLANTRLTYRHLGPNIYLIQQAPPKKSPALGPAIEETSTLGFQTGSHIFRKAGSIQGPIDQITALELERSGSQTLAALIKFIPAVCGNSTSTAISNGGDGTTKVTLRGLPANNTLVLINGQRTSFDGLAGDSVDLNTISPAIISQIDIYKDGASAIYGSEAIAGVVNIATITSFDGMKLSQYAGQTADGRSLTLSTDALWGVETQTSSALFALSYYSQEGLFSRDRSLSANADARTLGGGDNRSSATPNSRITLEDQTSIVLKNDIQSATPSPSDFRPTTSEDLFNFSSQTSTISPANRFSSYAFFSSDISQHIRWHSQLIASRTNATITLASTPIFTAFTDSAITVSKDNIYNPFGVDITDIRRRLVELSPRQQENTSKNLHINTGLAIDQGMTIWKANIYWNQVNAEETISNVIDGSKAARALGPSTLCRGIDIDGCEPLNLFGSAGSISQKQLDYLFLQNHIDGKSELKGLNIDVSGNALEAANMSIGYAGGIELRQEKSELAVVNDSSNIIGGSYHAPTSGERQVFEAYGELLFPFAINRPWAETIELEMATRLANSSDFGQNISPKAGIKYSLNSNLLFRGTYSRGYRAPSINELYKSGTKSYAQLFDPCSTSNAVAENPGCSQQSDPSLNQFLTEYRGDTNLSPEISKNFTFGITYNPANRSGFQLTADLFDIRLSNIIDSNPQMIINQNARNGLFSDLVKRDKNGNITLIEAPFINIGKRHIQGVDLSLRYGARHFQWALNASHIRKFQQQLNEYTRVENLAGTFRDAAENGNGSLPNWKANTGITWMLDNVEFSYNLNYISGLKELIQGEGSPRYRNIQSWITHDVQMQSQYFSYDLTIGIDNLFNQAPPFAATAFSDNYDAHAYDIKGRFIYVKIGKQF